MQQALTCNALLQACTLDGTTYDISNIVPYVMKHKKHPVTGEPLALKDIVKLNFAKSAEGEYICPMLKKVFTDHTHIVAIRTSGNVYCWEVRKCTTHAMHKYLLCWLQVLHCHACHKA